MSKQTENANPRQDFGRRLRKLRQDKGWTLAELAERSGLVISTISKAERGIIALTYDRLAMLAQALEVDLAAFFNAEGETFAPGSCGPKGGIKEAGNQELRLRDAVSRCLE